MHTVLKTFTIAYALVPSMFSFPIYFFPGRLLYHILEVLQFNTQDIAEATKVHLLQEGTSLLSGILCGIMYISQSDNF